MKTVTLASVCFLLLSPLSCMAGSDSPLSSPQDAGLSGKTRYQVRAEIVTAERDGWISSLRQPDYPPSDAQLRRNRESYQARAAKSEYLHASTSAAW